jgi:hypothetical protein
MAAAAENNHEAIMWLCHEYGATAICKAADRGHKVQWISISPPTKKKPYSKHWHPAGCSTATLCM